MPPTPRDPRYHVKGNDPHKPKERTPVPTQPQAPEKENDQKKPEEKSLVRYGQNPYMEIANQYNPGYCPLLVPKPKPAEPEKYDFKKPPREIFLDMMYVGCTITMADRISPLVDMAYLAAIICPRDEFWRNTKNIQMFCNECKKTGEYWVLQKGKKKIIKDLEDGSGLSNWLHFLETTLYRTKVEDEVTGLGSMWSAQRDVHNALDFGIQKIFSRRDRSLSRFRVTPSRFLFGYMY